MLREPPHIMAPARKAVGLCSCRWSLSPSFEETGPFNACGEHHLHTSLRSCIQRAQSSKFPLTATKKDTGQHGEKMAESLTMKASAGPTVTRPCEFFPLNRGVKTSSVSNLCVLRCLMHWLSCLCRISLYHALHFYWISQILSACSTPNQSMVRLL